MEINAEKMKRFIYMFKTPYVEPYGFIRPVDYLPFAAAYNFVLELLPTIVSPVPRR